MCVVETVIVMLIVSTVTARVDTVHPYYYITLDIDCKDHMIKILTQTLDPFSGVVFVRPISSHRQVGHEGPRFCKSIGRGRHEVSIEVGAGQCGWKREGQKVRLDLYVQYDAHVQQVIDEQISVECDMATREGKIVTVLYGEEGMSVPVQSEVEQSLVIKEYGEKDMEDRETDAPLIAKRGRMDDDHVRVIGWLDISEGSIQGGKSISRPLEEGEFVMIAAKVKQVEGMDVMMTRCGMEDRQGEVIILTDERGCSLDRELVGNIQTKYNEAVRVKEMFTNLQVPKFGGAGHLTVKCSVVVCDGRCPLSPCDQKDDPIHMRDMIVLETQAVVRQGETLNISAAAAGPSADSHSYNTPDMIQADSQLCLSPARIVVAFGTLFTVLVLALLFSCVLWIKARRIMPRPPQHPGQRGPYVLPSRPRPYIRVLT